MVDKEAPMAMVVTEKQLEAHCQELLSDEQVLACGLFQPYGSGVAAAAGLGLANEVTHDVHLGGVAGFAVDVAGGVAAQRGLASATDQPPWTALAVTAAHIYAFDASAAGGLAASHTFSGPPYATWNRAAVAVHTRRYVASFTLTIDDHDTGTSFAFKGNSIYKVNGKLVAHLLADDVS